MPGREGSRCLTRQEQVASYGRALVMTAATATMMGCRVAPPNQKGIGLLKILKKRCKQKGTMFPQLTSKLDGLGKTKEHAPLSEHVHLHLDIGHIHKYHLQATLLPQLSKYAHTSAIYLYCA